MKAYLLIGMLMSSNIVSAHSASKVEVINVLDGSIGRCSQKADAYKPSFGAYLIHSPKVQLYGEIMNLTVKYNKFVCRDQGNSAKFKVIQPLRPYTVTRILGFDDSGDLERVRIQYLMKNMRLRAIDSESYEIISESTYLRKGDSRLNLRLNLKDLMSEQEYLDLMKGKSITVNFDLGPESNYEITSAAGEVFKDYVAGAYFRVFVKLTNNRGQIVGEMVRL